MVAGLGLTLFLARMPLRTRVPERAQPTAMTGL
jgi:hypothetical protein